MAESFFATLKTSVLLSAGVADENPCRAGGRGVDRGALQPPPAPLCDRAGHPSGVRTAILNPDRGSSPRRLTPCPPTGGKASEG
jgi:hypothetical protein